MQRYQQLLGIIAQKKPATIIEVGTWDGERAKQMAAVILEVEGQTCHYVGFDLFEGASDKTDAEELNVKAHNSKKAVSDRLKEVKQAFPDRFEFDLYKGNTRKTLKGIDLSQYQRPILAFIDGGHSCATIANDLNALMDADTIIMDDFYIADDSGGCTDLTKFGCNTVLETVGEEGKNYFVLPVADRVQGGGRVHMVSVGEEFKLDVKRKLEVKTKNSVSDDAIQRNILYALSKGLPEVRRYYPHTDKVTFVSGGGSFLEHLPKIRAEQRKGNYLVCVKTSHDQLIAAGIIPDACMLLDPRAHVVDFIENPHPDVHYLVASQVYWETLKHLLQHKANITLYHAMVNAGEQEMLGTNKFMILGGSTSATRGISVLHTLGFRDFRLYGYDSSWEQPPGPEYNAKYEGEAGKRPMKEDFWTTAELIAQTRDLESLFDPGGPNDAKLEVIGSKKYLTLGKHTFDRKTRSFEVWDWEPRKTVKAA